MAGVITDETGTGNLVFSTSPILTTPNIGAASATLTLANGSTLITAGAYSTTLNATGTTSVTLPTSGTLATTTTANTTIAGLIQLNDTVSNTSTSLTSTAFNSLSDRTLKEDVVLINNAMEVLKLLQPVSFKWKDNGKKSYGLIAQEVEEILPELIETDSNGIKSVNYTAIIPFLINAIVEISK